MTIMYGCPLSKVGVLFNSLMSPKTNNNNLCRLNVAFFQTYNISVAIVEIQDKTVSKSIWLKSGFYLSNHIEDLINHHYWSFSVIFILTNQIVTYLQWTLGFIRLINNRKTFHLKHVIWIVAIMMQYANTNFIQKFTISNRELSDP